MPNPVVMPSLGESVVEGTITRWLKQPGESIEEYEPLLEVNTDKVDSEIPSPVSGTLLKVMVEEGTTVQAGELLAWIGQAGEAVPGEDGPAVATADTVPVQVAQPEAAASAELIDETRPVEVKPTQETAEEEPQGERLQGFISPVVGRIAGEHQVDLTKVKGTGLGGRITKKDVLDYVERHKEDGRTQAQPAETPLPVQRTVADDTKPPSAEPAPKDTAPTAAPAPGEILPLNPVRRAIADHMVMSKRTSPHVTTVMEADLSKVVSHRSANKAAFDRDGVNLTFTAYFVSAAVNALKAYPVVNSSWSEEGIKLHRQINIGMATSLGEGGLIVPVIKNADGLSLLGLARLINDLANRARTRKLQPDEVKGGTFTITNHGTSGSLFASPIINQPQCAILGVGAIQKRVVVINDAIAIRQMVYVTLTFDHRILDGAIADYFLGTVVKSLEQFQA